LNLQDNKKEITQLLNFLDNLENSTLIFTKANADENGIMINNMINEYCIKNKNKAKLFDNLGSLKYLSLMKIATAVIGNSSSGICESPFFKTPCINIGDRQKGRICADNIINAKINKLNDALKILNSSTYKNNVKNMKNPFSNKNASQNIINVLKNKNLKTLFYKEFVDL
ncbi:UDP-N-acetylglucosamine 2-epimerase, partial [Campylobacter lari]|nr:UDP-N-acetylglucosamine 2-epimerase [Campylobacter lari]